MYKTPVGPRAGGALNFTVLPNLANWLGANLDVFQRSRAMFARPRETLSSKLSLSELPVLLPRKGERGDWLITYPTIRRHFIQGAL